MSRAEYCNALQSPAELAAHMAQVYRNKAARARHEKSPLAVDTFRDVADRFEHYGVLPCCLGCQYGCAQAGTLFGVVLECRKGRYELSPKQNT